MAKGVDGRREANGTHVTEPQTGRRGSVLVVDDNPGDVFLARDPSRGAGLHGPYRAQRSRCARHRAPRTTRRRAVRRSHARARRLRGVPADQTRSRDPADSRRADHRAARPRRQDQRDRRRRRRLPGEAVQFRRAHRTSPLAHAPQALHRRSRFGRIGHHEPRADDRSARPVTRKDIAKGSPSTRRRSAPSLD